MPGVQQLYDVCEATWPPARRFEEGVFTFRDGAGGGKRVSAATARQPVTADKLPRAEEVMRGMDQPPLFMIRDGEEALDALLAEAGYDVIDPVNLYACPMETLTAHPLPQVTTFTIWEPLAIMRDIWAAGGIGPARVEVMRRAQGPKTGLFGRLNARPAGTGYVGLHRGVAMVHALEILPDHRGQGLGGHMMRQAAHWAADQGGTHMSVICTQANTGANALYTSLGMRLVGTYHYRIKEDAPR
ncbi:GNAT family N-acetyltransferase [Roseovarius faecimaris]|nr:GNAT family N-acetyltransferase [Roseovarius faecimaris]